MLTRHGRSALWLTVAVIGFLNTAPVPAADVVNYSITKYQWFNQITETMVEPYGMTPLYFQAIVRAKTSGSVSSTSIELPSGAMRSLAPKSNELSLFEGFQSIDALDASYPAGRYLFRFTTANDGNVTASLSMPEGGLLPPIRINNFAAAQTIDPGSPFDLTWTPVAGSRPDDFLIIWIDDTETDATLLRSPWFGQAGALHGGSSSFRVPAGALAPDHSYKVYFQLNRSGQPNSTDYPGAVGQPAFYTTTILTIRASSQVAATVMPLLFDYWRPANPQPEADDYIHSAYGEGTFVLMGDSGTVATSADGSHWSYRSTQIGPTLDIGFGGGQFVATLASGGFSVSNDGIGWEVIAPTIHAEKLAYGGGVWLAVGRTWPQVHTSVDGRNWVPQTSQLFPTTDVSGFDVAAGYINGQAHFLFCGDSRTRSSTEGIHWTIVGAFQGTIRKLAGGASGFIGVWTPSSWLISTPGDRGWLVHTASGISERNIRELVIDAAGSRYGALFGLQGGSSYWTTSTNRVNWEPARSTAIEPLLTYSPWRNPVGVAPSRTLVLGGGIDVAAGSYGRIYSRAGNGVWTRRDTNDAPRQVRRLVEVNKSCWLLKGDRGALRSDDAAHWTEIAGLERFSLADALYAQNTYVAVGTRGEVLYSEAGLDWTQASIAVTNQLRRLTYGNGRFLCIGEGGQALVSKNGRDWTASRLPAGSDLQAVAFGGGKFVAVGKDARGGVAWRSANGAEWSSVVVANSSFLDVAYGDGVFVAVGSGDYASTDGERWIQRSFGIGPFYHIAFAHGVFMLIDSSGNPHYSPSEKEWGRMSKDFVFAPQTAGMVLGRLAVVDDLGRVFLSPPIADMVAPRLSMKLGAEVELTLDIPLPGDYRIEHAERIGPAETWSPMATIRSQGGSSIVNVPRNLAGAERYYRAVRKP